MTATRCFVISNQRTGSSRATWLLSVTGRTNELSHRSRTVMGRAFKMVRRKLESFEGTRSQARGVDNSMWLGISGIERKRRETQSVVGVMAPPAGPQPGDHVRTWLRCPALGRPGWPACPGRAALSQGRPRPDLPGSNGARHQGSPDTLSFR